MRAPVDGVIGYLPLAGTTNEATGLCHSIRRRCGAARRARTAGRQNTTHRRALGTSPRRFGRSGSACSVHARLLQLGWVDGRNVHIDARWSAGRAADARKYATELATLAPDVILASGSASAGPTLAATHIIPVVFVTVPDPVGAGFVQSLSRPGGNATGFIVRVRLVR
ncbi:ABC transporter substrate binding protein [Bradyrhizobium sp. ISRA442]|uniref:ABC transporter substrate binding protein n=1 Tax=Bradyrhizobium sp. ISRA442 TaxID=2866197 RepID=UPI00404B9102